VSRAGHVSQGGRPSQEPPDMVYKNFGKKSKKTFVELIATPPPKTVLDWLVTTKYGRRTR
jgi:hypothetical protein